MRNREIPTASWCDSGYGCDIFASIDADFEAFSGMNEDELCLLIGKRVRYFRRLSNLTQAQLAERANLSVNYVSEIETGVASPTLKTLLKLSQELNVELKEFFDSGQQGNPRNLEGRKRDK